MSEIRINIIDKSRAVSGDLHASVGDFVVAALTAEPETIEELETALERFVRRESDWSVFRSFRNFENFSPFDAGLLVIDLASKIVIADSTYSGYSTQGSVRIKNDDGEGFDLPYRLSDDWKHTGSMPEFEGWQAKRRAEIAAHPPFDARRILFGKPLFEFIASEPAAHNDSTDENLFTEIHARWLMTAREDLRGRTPREILLEKQDFIDSDLQSRALQWSFTKRQPPALPQDCAAFRFAGFGTHETVVYYDFVLYLLGECFESGAKNVEDLEKIARQWLNSPRADYDGRTPASIVESERRRINLTATAHECMIDEDCEMCRMTALDYIDTPMFRHLDGSGMEYDRFEFSFFKTREEWEEDRRRDEEFNRRFNEKQRRDANEDDAFFDSNEEIS